MLSSLVRLGYHLALQIATLLVGTIMWVFQVGTWSATLCVLVVARLFPLLCHNLIPSGIDLQIPPQFLFRKTRGEFSRSDTECWGNWTSLVDSLFLLEKPESQEGPLSVVLCQHREGAMWIACSYSSY